MYPFLNSSKYADARDGQMSSKMIKHVSETSNKFL